MVQGGGGARLAVESMEQLGVGAGAQDLDGHRPAQARVARPVDLAHGAGAQAIHHLVGADARPGGEGVCHVSGEGTTAGPAQPRPTPSASATRLM